MDVIMEGQTGQDTPVDETTTQSVRTERSVRTEETDGKTPPHQI